MIEGNEGYVYEVFRKIFNNFKEERKNDISNKNFIANIENNLQKAKIFHINEKQKNFFVSGKVKVEKHMDIKLPFNEIFLDVIFTKKELKEYGIKIKSDELIGLLICRGYVYNQKDDKDVSEIDNVSKSVGENIRITLLTRKENVAKEERTGKILDDLNFETFYKNVNFYDYGYSDENLINNPPKDKQANEFWYKFFLNIVRFVNFPNVILKEHNRTEANIKRRLKKGKITTPKFIIVKLTGELQKYIDDVYEKPKFGWHYTYSFDVKGHYRNLINPRYKKTKKIWIEPFVKGEGKKIESLYKIQRKKIKCIT